MLNPGVAAGGALPADGAAALLSAWHRDKGHPVPGVSVARTARLAMGHTSGKQRGSGSKTELTSARP